jgi:outer membrane protein TolC
MIALVLWNVAVATPMTVDDVLRAALDRDPTLVEAEARVVAAEGVWRASRGLRHDPTLEARAGFGLAQHEAALTQPISLSGEGVAATRAAEADLRAEEHRRDRRRLEVAAEVRRLLVVESASQAEVARTEEVVRLTTELRVAAERRLAEGDGAELDVHLARLEEAAATADAMQAHAALLLARETLAATSGVGFDVDLPDDPLDAVPATSEPGARADHAAAIADVEAAEAATRRERAAALPPVDVGVWAQVQNVATTPGPGGVDVAPWSWSENAAWSVGPALSMILPLWNGNRAAIATADAERVTASAHLASIEARIDAEQRGGDARRDLLARVAGTSDPTLDARAALDGIAAAVDVGALGPADAAILRARVLDGWRRAARARAEAARITVDLALAESWPTLLPSGP